MKNLVKKYMHLSNNSSIIPNQKKEALDRWLESDYDSFNHDCELDGHFPELLGTAPDGTAFYKCKECGEEIEE